MNVGLVLRKANAVSAPFIAVDAAFLQRLLLFSTFLNLAIVACIGVLLRAFPYLADFPLSYKNLLHGHSHFAFGGWIMPALIAFVMKAFPELSDCVKLKHWIVITALTLFSAYGMLITFSLQGYKPLSIAFSTLSIFAGYYFAAVVLKALKRTARKTSLLFLKRGIFYMLLSSLGPFATGLLMALGKAGTPLYYDVIYFYLHFQYNGFFVFTVLALFYRLLEQQNSSTHGAKVLYLLNAACFPTYLLSVLWHQPPIWINIVGGAGPLLQCIALYYLGKDLVQIKMANKLVKAVLQISFACFFLKTILQLVSSFPVIANLAYLQRNFVIAYLHLVLLGFITLFLIAYAIHSLQVYVSRLLRFGVAVFISAFVLTECLLVAKPLAMMFGCSFSNQTSSLLLCSVFLPVGICMILTGLRHRLLPNSSFINYKQQNKQK